MFLKVLACEIAFRELCHCAARSRHLVDFEFLSQGYHDTPRRGREEIQRRIDAVPAGKYDALVIGYALCSNILVGLTTRHTPLVIPRAHDCITFFLGSKERYQQHFEQHPGTYYYTSGWLECRLRRGDSLPVGGRAFLPASQGGGLAAYEELVDKYGEEKARYLIEAMGEWAAHYGHGALIDYDFTKPLKLREQVQTICAERGWEFMEVPGDLSLFQRLLDGGWDAKDFLTVKPGEKVVAAYNGDIIATEPATSA